MCPSKTFAKLSTFVFKRIRTQNLGDILIESQLGCKNFVDKKREATTHQSFIEVQSVQ